MNSIDYGVRFLGNLALIFITLKLTGFIDWSWWGVTAPLWGAFAVGAAGCLLAAVVLLLLFVVARTWGYLTRKRSKDHVL